MVGGTYMLCNGHFFYSSTGEMLVDRTPISLFNSEGKRFALLFNPDRLHIYTKEVAGKQINCDKAIYNLEGHMTPVAWAPGLFVDSNSLKKMDMQATLGYRTFIKEGEDYSVIDNEFIDVQNLSFLSDHLVIESSTTRQSWVHPSVLNYHADTDDGYCGTLILTACMTKAGVEWKIVGYHCGSYSKPRCLGQPFDMEDVKEVRNRFLRKVIKHEGRAVDILPKHDIPLTVSKARVLDGVEIIGKYDGSYPSPPTSTVYQPTPIHNLVEGYTPPL
jgi:hypothetical protein